VRIVVNVTIEVRVVAGDVIGVPRLDDAKRFCEAGLRGQYPTGVQAKRSRAIGRTQPDDSRRVDAEQPLQRWNVRDVSVRYFIELVRPILSRDDVVGVS